jgi:multiple sugar transport system substrate-binding protein
MRHTTSVWTLALAGVLMASACSSTSGGDAGGVTTIEYWLWDANQTAQYQACADDFMKANSDIKVNITQTGWNDYWNNLTTNLTAGTGPDVFTDHLNYFANFLDKGQIVDLQPYIDKDSVDMTQYFPGLADLWKDKDGHSYGLPKDWDTVALFYNADMAKAAGYTDADMADLTWNPTDGGTWEKLIAKLTVDTNGKHGDEPGFDKNSIATYGMAMEGSGAGFSQTQLSEYVLTTGWTFTDKNPWGTKYNFSDPRFEQTAAWWYSLVQKGYMNDLEMSVSMDGNSSSGFAAGKFAAVVNGDWMISSFTAPNGGAVKFAPTPIGPDGKRASLFNGLTDAITTSSKHPDQAWQWVKYLGSTQCQQHVADAGVVFPAIKSLSDDTVKARAAKGVDVSAFMVHVQDGTTFPPPITEHYPDVLAIQQPVMDDIMSGKVGVDALGPANDQINALFTSGG